MQELESLLENLNKVVPQSQDEEHQRVAREYASLNESLFQCLESHRYWKFNEDFGPKLLCCSKSIRRNLLQMNTVVDQHNLILMWEIMNLVAPLLSLNYCRPYTALNNKLKHKTSKERISPSSWTSKTISESEILWYMSVCVWSRSIHDSDLSFLSLLKTKQQWMQSYKKTWIQKFFLRPT